MKDLTPRRRFLFCAAGVIFLSLFLSRMASILFSYAATDILYSESVLPTVLSYLRQLLLACSFGAGIAALTAAVYADDRRAARTVLWIHIALLLVDVLCAFAVDAISGSVVTSLLGIAALFNLGDWLLSALLLVLAHLCIKRCRSRGRSSSSAILFAVIVYLGGRMLLQLIYILQFLFEVEFAPYASELIQMTGEILQVLVMSGGVVWLAAVGLHTLFDRFVGENGKFT